MEGDQHFLYNVISTIKEMSQKMSLILQQYNKNASCTTSTLCLQTKVAIFIFEYKNRENLPRERNGVACISTFNFRE